MAKGASNYFDGPPALFSFFLSFFSGLGSHAGGSLAGKDSREASSTGSIVFGSGGLESGALSLSVREFNGEVEHIRPSSGPAARPGKAGVHVYSSTAGIAKLELDNHTHREFRAVLVGAEVMRRHHVGFRAVREPSIMRVVVHAAA